MKESAAKLPSFQSVLISGVPAVLFICLCYPHFSVLIREVPAVLFIWLPSFQSVLMRGDPAVLCTLILEGLLIDHSQLTDQPGMTDHSVHHNHIAETNL